MLAGYVELLRLHNVALTMLATAIGVLSSILYFSVALEGGIWRVYLLASCVTSLIAAGGYVVNDYYDIDIDSVNKPWRPLPSGIISMRSALLLSMILFIGGTALSTVIGPLSSVLAAFTALLLLTYSKTFKRRGFSGNIIVSLCGALSIVYGVVSVVDKFGLYNKVFSMNFVLSLVPALHAFLLILLREIVKGIEDYEGDKIHGVKTLVVVYGIEKTYGVLLVLSSLLICISIVPLFAGLGIVYLLLAIVVDVLVVYALYILRPRSLSDMKSMVTRGAWARRVLKYAFAIGIMAFLLGFAEIVLRGY